MAVVSAGPRIYVEHRTASQAVLIGNGVIGAPIRVVTDPTALSSTSLCPSNCIVQHGRPSGAYYTLARSGTPPVCVALQSADVRLTRPQAFFDKALAGPLDRRRADMSARTMPSFVASASAWSRMLARLNWRAATFPRLVMASNRSRSSSVNVIRSIWAMEPSCFWFNIQEENLTNEIIAVDHLVVHPPSSCSFRQEANARVAPGLMAAPPPPKKRMPMGIPIPGGLLDGVTDLGPGLKTSSLERQRP
jgi:hypothetical protein